MRGVRSAICPCGEIFLQRISSQLEETQLRTMDSKNSRYQEAPETKPTHVGKMESSVQPKEKGPEANVPKSSNRDNKRARKKRQHTAQYKVTELRSNMIQHDSMKWKISNPVVIPNWMLSLDGKTWALTALFDCQPPKKTMEERAPSGQGPPKPQNYSQKQSTNAQPRHAFVETHCIDNPVPHQSFFALPQHYKGSE